jgi:hypothetical protein
MAVITDLSTASSAGTGDYLVISQSGTDKKVVAGKFAILAQSQTFLAAQAIQPAATNVNGLEVNMPTSTSGKAWQIKYNGTERAFLQVLGGQATSLTLSAVDTGSSYGPYIAVLGNNNASTPSAGALILRNRGATDYSIWPDASGNLRIHTALPTSALDTAGTVVGAQTSCLSSKDIVGDPLSIDAVLASVQRGAEAVRRFTYKSGAYNGEEFSGIVTDYAPRYGMDRDEAHPAGRSLNVINAIGDMMILLADLAQRVAALEAAQKTA